MLGIVRDFMYNIPCQVRIGSLHNQLPATDAACLPQQHPAADAACLPQVSPPALWPVNLRIMPEQYLRAVMRFLGVQYTVYYVM